MKWTILLSPKVKKQIRKLPKHIVDNFLDWVEETEVRGLEEVRKIPGYHDEQLKGSWAGFRSIRLSKAYRAIYRVENQTLRVVLVVEVNKHEY